MGTRRFRGDVRLATSRWQARALAVLGSLWMAGQASAEPTPQGVNGRCEIQFTGSSTLHDFSGAVSARAFQLESHRDPYGGHASWSGSIEVPVADMDTGIERRDRKMRTMFDAERFPLIVAEIPSVVGATLAAARSGAEPDVDLRLTIRDVTRRVAAKLSHWTEEGERASFDAEFEVSLESFGLEVPPVLGLLRVGDVVAVHAHLTLEGLPARAPETAAFGRLPGSLASGS